MATAGNRFSDPGQGSIETAALLALGRLNGALSMAAPATLRLFATGLLRDLLITALRQEGHAFTDQRFHAWFAGITMLTDQQQHPGRPPKVLCEAILTELTHSRWDLLADLATRFHAVLLAPGDHIGSDMADETARQDVQALIATAHDLIAGIAPSPDPMAAVAHLHQAAAAHRLFAPVERAAEPVAMGAIRMTVERAVTPSPGWALELLWGAHWHAAGLLPHPLPFPGLIRLDTMEGNHKAYDDVPDDFANNASTIQAASLHDVAHGLYGNLAQSNQLARHLATSQPGKRRSSRAPALLELLTAFGPLRSAQLEALLGVTRLGLRAMLGTLDEAGLVTRITLAGVHLYSVDPGARPTDRIYEPVADTTFSAGALGEYDAAMAEIDALLARSGVSVDDEGWEDEA